MVPVHRPDVRAASPGKSSSRFEARLARDPGSRYAALALRHRVFAGEMGARLRSPYPGLDWDELDPLCDHLIVRERQSDAVVATTRLFSDHRARLYGRFYSEGEFDLGPVLRLPGRFLEVGRTCVDSSQRGGVALISLWNALAEYASEGGYDYLMGCASIPPGPGGYAVEAVKRQIGADNWSPEHLRMQPVTPVPEELRCERDESGIPPLLRAYLRFGAWVCGEPCWDPHFNVMDFFVLLPIERLQSHYGRRFQNEQRELPCFHGTDALA